MRIGELSRRSGFSIDTLRYYDRIGLLRPATRNPVSGFREYAPDAPEALDLVRLARLAGLSLPQIRRILAAARHGTACDKVVPLLGRKIDEIDRAIRALRTLRARLSRALRTRPRRRKGSVACPILSGLEEAP